MQQQEHDNMWFYQSLDRQVPLRRAELSSLDKAAHIF